MSQTLLDRGSQSHSPASLRARLISQNYKPERSLYKTGTLLFPHTYPANSSRQSPHHSAVVYAKMCRYEQP